MEIEPFYLDSSTLVKVLNAASGQNYYLIISISHNKKEYEALIDRDNLVNAVRNTYKKDWQGSISYIVKQVYNQEAIQIDSVIDPQHLAIFQKT